MGNETEETFRISCDGCGKLGEFPNTKILELDDKWHSITLSPEGRKSGWSWEYEEILCQACATLKGRL